jgi:hypothetical protein
VHRRHGVTNNLLTAARSMSQHMPFGDHGGHVVFGPVSRRAALPASLSLPCWPDADRVKQRARARQLTLTRPENIPNSIAYCSEYYKVSP